MTMHHPPHIFVDDTWYIITSATVDKRRLLKPSDRKEITRDLLKDLVIEFKLTLAAWVILDNHYHLLVKCHLGSVLTRVIARLNGRVSYELNKLDGTRGRRVWDNYWDTCIRAERDYWVRFNYIHHNPVKHGYTTNMADWPFSSYNYYLSHRGEEWLADSFRSYPIIDFTEARDD